MRKQTLLNRLLSVALVLLLVGSLFSGVIPGLTPKAEAAANTIENDSLSVQIGDLGQIAVMNIKNNTRAINFVLPNTESNQNNTAHQWMGEMIFATRTAATKEGLTGAFTEVDTNRTLAAGGSTTASNISASNPYITKTANGSSSVEVNFIGQDLSSTTARTMKGFDVKSVFDMATDDGSMLWSITLKNKSDQYIEFGDIGLPMAWNNKYRSTSDTYSNRLTAHSYAGADSGYGYAIRCSGEGNYMLFTPVVATGARVEYVDHWVGTGNGTSEYRSGSLYTNWLADQGGWYPGLSVYYIHSKNIRTQTGRGYFTDDSSLILGPGEEKTYSFKFSAIRAGDGQPGTSASDPQNASTSNEEREKNFRSILYKEGMIDAVAVPSFQTVINMETLLDLHYDDNLIDNVNVDIQCVHENDPYDSAHIPNQRNGMVNNSRTGLGEHGATGYEESVQLVETKVVDGEQHHIYRLKFGCIGNNSVRVDYRLKSTGDAKFTEFEFNVLAPLDQIADTHANFMANTTQDNNPNSATYGIYSDWYFASGKDSRQQSHWGDDWSHDNVNFMAMKNFLDPDPDQVKSLERYLIDFMWTNYMKNTQENFIVANYLSASGIYGTSSSPYTRTFSEVMEATAFFNMYRLVKAYPDLIDYREPADFYLKIAYGIYHNRAGSGTTGFYGEQQIPDMIEALYEEGLTAEGDALKQQFAYTKGRAVANTTYPYGSEFEYDNTGEEGAYSSAKALREYYPTNNRAAAALNAMAMANRKTRAMRGIQPTWYHYADPVFRGGEGWWNFQYTASLAGYIMDDYLRYQDDTADSAPWAERLSYAAKLSNFNAVNMGQISSAYMGSVSWRFTMYKGGAGAQNVNDGGTRVMNNGWNDFSGESDEGIYGSLLSISADITTDPVFGLFGYGANVTKTDGVYAIEPTDGFGKRINLIDERIYVESIQDAIAKADIAADGSSIKLTLRDEAASTHLSQIGLTGAGVQNGFFGIFVDGEKVGQVYISGNEGTANVLVNQGTKPVIEIKALADGENEAPKAEITVTNSIESPSLAALVPFTLRSIVTDDGAPADSTITYAWAVTSAPEGGELTLTAPTMSYTEARATAPGKYVVTLTVSDGEKSSDTSIELDILDAPERTAPVIVSASGEANYLNPTLADLTVEAIADQYYQGELSYAWTLVSAPNGAVGVIVNGNQQNGTLLANGNGTYVVRITVTDADKSSYKDVEVVMTQADGVQRAKSITTKAKVAPALPATVPVVLPDGSTVDAAVTWDPVDPASYAIIGTFDVKGTTDVGVNVDITVYVITGTRVNVAPDATPTASTNTPGDLGGVHALHDEGHGTTNGTINFNNEPSDPSSSSDTSKGVWHNWGGGAEAQGSTAWVRYTWDEPIIIDSQDVYYFRDGGGNFQPKNMVLEYLDASGIWRPMPDCSALENTLNRYNNTTFGPVRTTSVRMTMDPVTLGCGIIEWKVYGYSSDLNFKALNAAIEKANSIMDLLKNPIKQELLDEIQAAYELMSDEVTTQDMIDAETEKLLALIDKALASVTGELGEDAAPYVDSTTTTNDHIYTDYVASWENLYGIANRDFEPTRSNGGTRLGWGNWSQETGSLHYVGYRWDEPVTLGGFDIYWYDDGSGTRVPSDFKLQYLAAADGEWKNVTLITAPTDAMKLNQYNRVYFAPITCVDLRLIMTTASNASGIYRWKVYESKPSGLDLSALEKAIADAEALAVEDYTEDSYAPIPALLEAAKAVLENPDATQEEVDAAAKALNEALAALVTKADLVEELIDAIPDPATLNDEETIKAAREAYDALTDEQKTQVENYLDLLKAEAEYAKLVAEKAKQDAEDAAAAAEAAKAAALADAKYAAAKAATEYAERIRDLGLDEETEAQLDALLVQGLADIEAAEAKEEVEAILKALLDAMDDLKPEIPVEPTKPDEPTEPTKPDEPTEPTNPDQPTEPTNPDQPTVPVEPTKPGLPCVDDETCPGLKQFTDMPARGNWAHDPIDWAVVNEITNGMTATTFVPNGTITRGQAVTFLWRAAGKPALEKTETDFTDLVEGAYYYDAVLWAVEKGITKGMTATTFNPNGSCTRGQIVTFLYRFAGSPEVETADSPFTDLADGAYYSTPVAWAVANEITNGLDATTFGPNATCTRAQVVTFLYREVVK